MSKSLNEETLKVTKKYYTEEVDEKHILRIYYFNTKNDEKTLKNLKSLDKAKNEVYSLINSDKLNSIGATALMVDDEKDNPIFTAFLNEETGKWDIEEDNFEEYKMYFYTPDEYKNTLLNQVYYSLTSAPDNVKKKAPELYASILRPDENCMTIDEVGDTNDSIGYIWQGDDAIINITLGDINLRKINMIDRVCDSFNLFLKTYGNKSFSIKVPDQLKFYNDVVE